jgi:DNA invertase Pin-like site-specific DNA recombinase
MSITDCTMIRVVAYFRMSDPKQEASIPEQKAWLASILGRESLDVVAEFMDAGIPGDEIQSRPGLQDLLAYCEREHREGRPVQALVCWEFGRFSRANSYRTAAIICRLMDAGVTRVLTNKGWIDFTNARDRLIQNLEQDLTNSGYAKKVSESVTRSCASRARKGQWTGGRTPYGYIVGPDHHLALGAPEHAEAVSDLFIAYDQTDTSLNRQAARLNKQGVPSPAHLHAMEAEAELVRLKARGEQIDPAHLDPGEPVRKRLERLHRVAAQKGKPWTKSSVWTILSNPLYTGDFYYGRRQAGKYHTVSKEKGSQERGVVLTKNGKVAQVENDASEWFITPDTHPALVSREAFERVKGKLLAANLAAPEETRRKRRNLDWPLSGLLECADCHGLMYGLTVPMGAKKNGQEQRAELRKYACGTYLEHGRGRCHFNAVLEEEVMNLIFTGLQERLSDPKTMDAIRRACQAARKGRKKDVASRSSALRKLEAQLKKDIRQGLENLGRLPPELLDDVAGQVLRWKEERTAALAELQELDALAAKADEEDRQVDAAIEAFRLLSEEILAAEELSEVRETLGPLVERVEMRFGHKPLGKGERTKSTLTSLTVHFKDVGTLLKPVRVSLERLATGRRG